MSATVEPHRCYEIKYSGSFPELRGEGFPSLVAIDECMAVVQRLRGHSEEPAEQVIREFGARTGLTERTPAELMHQIDQWLRMISRYVSGQKVITPLNTPEVWGGPVRSEEEFVHVANGVMSLAARLIRAYERKIPRAEARAFLERLDSKPQPRADGLNWPWDDDEDMVARIADAPPLESSKPRERQKLNAYERDLVRTHFSWSHDLTEIADHLGLEFDAVWSEHLTWREEQMILRGLVNEDGSDS